MVVELDDHHDSQIINAGLAADAGYRGTFGHEAENDLEELRATFARKAHTAAMERCLTALLRADRDRRIEELGAVRLRDLPDDATTAALLRRRAALGLSTDRDAIVMVDHSGRGYAAADVPMALRRARSTRISIDGNAHFCRGLLRTRYPDPKRHRCIGPRAPTADAGTTRPSSPSLRSASAAEHALIAGTPMSKMRAVQVVGYHTNLEMTEVPIPEPTGPFDVVVKIGGAGVCRTDLHILEGQWAEKSGVAAAVHDRPRERRLGARGRLARSPTSPRATR